MRSHSTLLIIFGVIVIVGSVWYSQTPLTGLATGDFSTFSDIAVCGTITESSVLTGAIASSLMDNESCFTVSADNIIFDGGGFALNGNGSGKGIVVTGSNNTITNFASINSFTSSLVAESTSLNLKDQAIESFSFSDAMVTVSNDFGVVVFNNPVTVNGSIAVDDVVIASNSIVIATGDIPDTGMPATFTIYATTALSLANRTPYLDGIECVACSEVVDDDTYVFTSSTIGSYSVGESSTTDVSAPTIEITSPEEMSLLNTSSEVTLSVVIDDDIVVDTIKVNSTLPNNTVEFVILSRIGTSTAYTAGYVLPNLSGLLTLDVFANDSTNNGNTSRLALNVSFSNATNTTLVEFSTSSNTTNSSTNATNGSSAETAPTAAVVATMCDESWECNNWNGCSDGKRTRSCTDNNECGTSENKPSEEESCEEEFCVSSFTCTAWSDCEEDKQIRTCTLENNECSPKGEKPSEEKECTLVIPEISLFESITEETKDTAQVFGIILLAILAGIGMFYYNKRKGRDSEWEDRINNIGHPESEPRDF